MSLPRMQESNLRPSDYRSNPFTRHRRGYKFRSPGIARPGLTRWAQLPSGLVDSSSAWLAGSIPNPHHRRYRSRQGKVVRGFYRFPFRKRRGLEPHPVAGLPMKYPRTAPLAHACNARERSLLRRGSCQDEVSAWLHHSLLQAFAAFDRLSGFSRGTTRLYLPAVASRSRESSTDPTPLLSAGRIVDSNWRMVVIVASSA